MKLRAYIDAPTRAIWEEEYAFARDAGFDAERAAHIASAASRTRNQSVRLAKPRPSPPPREIPGDEPLGMYEDGHIARIADADDSDRWRFIEESQSWEFASAADRILTDIMEAETGMPVSKKKYDKRLAEKDRLRDYAYTICHACESIGLPMYRNDGWTAWRYGVHSEHLEELPNYRRVCLNPYVAAMTRAGKLSALEYFLSLYEPWQYRFWTFTSGPRCRSFELRARVKWLHRRLSKLNALLKKRGFPCEFIFRATEFGTLENTEKGKKTGGSLQRKGRHVFYHPHIHAVLFVREFMSEGRWQLLLSVVHGFWKHHWDAGKLIENARECVKYVSKPGDMAALARSNPHELKRLYEATAGLRFVTPLGELKRQIRARKDAGLMLVRVTTDDGCIWREIKDPDHPFWQDEHSEKELNTLRALREEARSRRKTEGDILRVVKRCMPTVSPQRVKEPTVLLIGNVIDLDRIRTHPLVAKIREYTADAYRAGLAVAAMDEGGERQGLDQSSHGHTNCPRVAQWPPPRLEIDQNYIWEADKNPICAN